MTRPTPLQNTLEYYITNFNVIVGFSLNVKPINCSMVSISWPSIFIFGAGILPIVIVLVFANPFILTFWPALLSFKILNHNHCIFKNTVLPLTVFLFFFIFISELLSLAPGIFYRRPLYILGKQFLSFSAWKDWRDWLISICREV